MFKKLFSLNNEPDEEILSEIDDETLEQEDSAVLAEDNESAAQNDEEGQLALDVFQDEENLVIKSTIAGVQPDDLDISLSNDSITISGERRQERSETEADYFYRECYWGSFSRTINLPVEVDIDKAQAEIKDGILTLTIPKLTGKTRKVKVKAD